MISSQEIITQYKLEKHPEGGWYRRTYASKQKLGTKSLSSAIFYLLESGETSTFHSIKSDEMWHFYAGSPLKIHIFSPEGNYHTLIINNSDLLSYSPQLVVPAHHIFAAEVMEANSFSFVGCTVTPAFDFKDFRLYNSGEIQELAKNNYQAISHLL